MKDNRSVVRILAILELISQHNEGLTLGQIYRMLDYPKATVYDFLQTLYKADAIYYKDPRFKNYVIGSKIFSIGSSYIKNSNIIESGDYELQKYAKQYGRTVFITKRDDDKIIYIYKYQPSNSKIITPQEIGSISKDFSESPLGQCYAVFDRRINDGVIPHAQQIKQQRYTETSPLSKSYINYIAVPIWNFENRVCGVLESAELANERINHKSAIDSLIKISESISRKLGYMGDFSD